ncbi:hypothetical protein F0562_033499 [Nyssa sinensis]|uniref:Endoplasmic reticulum transmembrane protein n=1 Tax=Nyssa sinensis TaxID=561372 RepID=A0A5J5ADI1_9ASTE|nr:hypothetical protein F0562_033499 [Nyssa sinensis]
MLTFPNLLCFLHVSSKEDLKGEDRDVDGNRFPEEKVENHKSSPEIPHTHLTISEVSQITEMALEWVVLGYAAAAEAIMVLLLTLPGLDRLHKGMVSVTRNLLKPFLSVVPFCLFLLMDIYWKYETRPSCESPESCTPSEHLRHQKSIMKSQRNALLIAAALMFYWLLYSVTHLVVRIEQLNQRIEKLKSQD